MVPILFAPDAGTGPNGSAFSMAVSERGRHLQHMGAAAVAVGLSAERGLGAPTGGPGWEFGGWAETQPCTYGILAAHISIQGSLICSLGP